MDFIILNGKSSKLIGGLMIQQLPPITKPLMRTEEETIDGRDGDIVTKLGYSAYDKTITVGLYGDYDVDEVIRYFDSEGTVIFSNELDKYYNYQIFDQIDFEKLIRFKTATVTMHVQPFKFSSVEMPLVIENMLNIPDYKLTQDGITVDVSDGEITVSGTVSGATGFYIPINSVYAKIGKYKISCVASGDGINSCAGRIIQNAPVDAQSLGGTFIRMEENVSVDATMTDDQYYSYLWLSFDELGSVDFTLNITLIPYQFVVNNIGNTFSRPKLTLYGSGTIIVAVNAVNILVVDMSTDQITIDGESMEAYKEDVLLNRDVIGNYDSLRLKSGFNMLSWSGNVTKAVLENYSRWI